MRKEGIIGVLLIMMGLMMSSCEKQTFTIVQGTQWKIADCNVTTDSWQYTYDTDISLVTYDNNYYYATFDIPALTQYVFTDGNVQIYLIETNTAGEQIQRQLPFTRHREVVTINEEYPEGIVDGYYTETYDCVYGVGWVEFNYYASDFAYEESHGEAKDYKPNPCTFRVVMTW